uniref:Protein TIC 214 n=1 Tax=Pentadiplandra brazzeana TaxID=43545 RepID=A0A5B9RBI7_PENBA|nr:hypothetical protein RF1 [Pentadiplandra brazzeana]QEG53929.1 hypothetical protein RF1 [Pentadiplandra brazzeana]
MVLKSFILGNLVSLCMKIINSVVVVGLYYGFLITFSIGPSYLFLLRARVMDEGEEGTEKKVSATTGFIAGQLIMFISIYYAPLHLALGRPHTITVLALPYLLFHFFWNNHKHFFDYGSTTRNSMRNLRIQCVFLNNLIFQLFNHFILPSSMLARLVNIYMFRCNNKMLFVTSSFVGWLIGHILFMKWVGLVLVWIQQNNSIRSNVLIRSNKYKFLVSELRNSMARIFSILLFITCGYYLGRIPLLIFTKKLKGTSETKERGGTKQDQGVSTEEDPFPSLFSEEREDKTLFSFEKTIMSLLFDYKRWNKPNRYIKNNRFQNAVKNEMSESFFYICQSDGKERIFFTYPPSLSTFFEMIQKKILLFTKEELSSDGFPTSCSRTNEQKKNNLKKKFRNRIEALDLDKGSTLVNMLEKTIRFCNNATKKEYLPKIYDPFLHGVSRGRIKKFPSFPMITEMYIKKNIGTSCINKLHSILLNINYQKTQVNSEEQIKIIKFLFDVVITDPKDETLIKNFIEIKEIIKKVPRWSYERNPKIRSRKAKRDRIVIFTTNQPNPNNDIFINKKDIKNSYKKKEVTFVHYLQKSDFRRNLAKGSIRAKRRKTTIWEFFQANLHSPLFLDRIDKLFFFLFEILGLLKLIVRNLMWENKKKKFFDSDYIEKTNKIAKKEAEKTRIKIAEAWNRFILGQVLRSSALVTQSILRKYIILPLLIIIKNTVRMLLFQFPEWSEDLKDWKREIYIKCTYNGVPLSEREFPKKWLTNGMQIKILFPFCLKPWHRSKLQSSHKDPMKKKKEKGQKNYFCFLTIWGMETELPFGPAREHPSFFEPIFKKFKKKIRKLKTKSFLILRVFKKREKIFLKLKGLKETKTWVIKSFLFTKEKIKELLKRNRISLFGLREVYELSETKKDSITSNQMSDESSVPNRSMEFTNYSLTEKKMKDLIDRTKTIRNQIEYTKKKKNEFLIQEINNSSNKRSFYGKLLESSKNIWQILKKKNARFIHKLYYFMKFFMERVYIDIFLCIINIPRINTQLFLKSRKKIIDKYIYINQEKTNKTNKNTIYFISTLKTLLSNIKNINSKICFDLSSFSQAYVFYKLSKIQVNNLYNLKSVLQYNGNEISFFVKKEIKDYFEEQGIFHYELKDKTFLNLEINQWKNWFRSHYQYNLSQITWPRLISEKWRNRINQDSIVQNPNLNRWDSYEKDTFFSYEKQNDFEADSLLNQKQNLKKKILYNLFSYKSINYKEKKEKTFNRYKIDKKKNFNMSVGIPIHNYLVSNSLKKYHIMGIEKIPDRKYLDWRILNFWFRKKINIESWVDINTKSNKNIKTGVNNYQIIDQIPKKSLANQKRNLIDWMGINEEIPSCCIGNLELWFFPEFVLLSNAYKIKPWIIPIKLLLFHFNENQNLTKNITRKKKGFISSNEKQSLGLNNPNQEEKESAGQEELESDKQKQGNLGSVLSNQEKNIEENYAKSNIKKRRKKKQYKSNTQEKLHLFLKRYLYFELQWDYLKKKKILNNSKLYCLLLRLINPKEIAISSIQRGEMNLDILMIKNNLTLPEFMKKAKWIIEPIRLSIRNDEQFIIYQTIGISLVHNNKHQITQKYKKKSYLDKNNFDESIAKHQKITGNGDKNHYDFFVPENILSPKRRREFRILTLFNSRNKNDKHRNQRFDNNIKNCGQKNKDFDKDNLNLIKLKFFLWPNFRLEDLACMNRYWFNTNNGSRFSIVRIHMYPRFLIR